MVLEEWRDRVSVVSSDMRNWKAPEKVSICTCTCTQLIKFLVDQCPMFRLIF